MAASHSKSPKLRVCGESQILSENNNTVECYMFALLDGEIFIVTLFSTGVSHERQKNSYKDYYKFHLLSGESQTVV